MLFAPALVADARELHLAVLNRPAEDALAVVGREHAVVTGEAAAVLLNDQHALVAAGVDLPFAGDRLREAGDGGECEGERRAERA